MASTASAEDRLRRIGFVSNHALAHLDTEDALTELLERVRRVMHADTAVVLLLEPGGGELFAAAARGMDPEVHQGVRVPLGKGFAGRIAAERRPVLLERIDETTVVNQLLWERGLHTLLGVPLLVGGSLIGVLHVGTVRDHSFTEDDIHLLQLAGDRVALSIQAQRAQAARAAATELQRSLLPAKLPAVPTLDIAARYVPGGRSSVAGDWYDVFTLPSGRLGIVMGDVVGHDLPAAVVMGRFRSALRAYALETDDPAEVLTRLDRKALHFEPGMMATVLYGTLDSAFERLHLSSAGHLEPLLAVPGKDPEFVTLQVDPPIGAVHEARRHSTAVELPQGAVCCLYTDGLVERRYRPLDAGLDLLREAVSVQTADRVCAQVMRRLIGDEVPDDDVALLILRRQTVEEIGPLEVAVPAVPESLKEIRATMRRWLSAVAADPEAAGDLLLAVGEACTNVVEHAYGPAGGMVTVLLERRQGDAVVTVRDTGRWRRPRGINRGRGLLLMRKCADDVHVEHGEDGTRVVIRRALGQERGS
ncbi:SpoIIE family protein phosphatase [Amycolatopsis rhizosphaerae]|uniref:SpoIIE family protein phosphatase n=1 Tax=Amycolatopsis rhizosphaerae TaxID=2053003 RepID=A0A558D179_9PSEU|nr:SpoIIE family protein phosphatase [Amycolatopsis rhizosphaerae]TVT54777.1 SpoIIE family protein phosphatase [Amycolatopsis rhizosphaerae]